MKFLLLPLLLAATPVVAQPAPQAGVDAQDQALLAAEDRRFHAELTHDAAVLDATTAPDVTYVHFNGEAQDKAGVMNSFTRIPFTAIEPSDRHARVLGDTGVVRGQVTRHLPDRTLHDAYLAVYVRRGGVWQLLDWVSYAPPPATKAPAPKP